MIKILLLILTALYVESFNIGYKSNALSYLVSPYQQAQAKESEPSATGRSASSKQDRAPGPLPMNVTSYFGYEFSISNAQFGYR